MNRCNDSKDLAVPSKFWTKAETTRQKLDVKDPELPRKRKLPRRFEDGNAEPEFSSSCKQHFRRQ